MVVRIGILILAAQAAPSATDWPPALIAPLASAGGLGLLIWFMHIQLAKADTRAEAAEGRAEAAVESERALRDTIIRDVVPAMTRMNETAGRLLEAQMRGER